jgi:hypothetical protein
VEIVFPIAQFGQLTPQPQYSEPFFDRAFQPNQLEAVAKTPFKNYIFKRQSIGRIEYCESRTLKKKIIESGHY